MEIYHSQNSYETTSGTQVAYFPYPDPTSEHINDFTEIKFVSQIVLKFVVV